MSHSHRRLGDGGVSGRLFDLPDTVRPIIGRPVVSTPGGVQATVRGRTRLISNHVDVVWAVLAAATGHRTEAEVVAHAAEAGIDPSTAEAVLRDLLRVEILVDSRARYEDFHEFTVNPMEFSSDLRIADYVEYERLTRDSMDGARVSLPAPTTPTDDRASCRQFSDRVPSAETVAEVLSRATHRVPSAGALYPIHIGVVVNRPIVGIETGAYRYDSATHELVEVRPSSPEERAFALNREDHVHGSPIVLVVAGDLKRQTRKYANRGYRYTLVESGIAVDRVLRASSEIGLSTLVYGGFDDAALASLLFPNEPQLQPLITVAIGFEGEGTPAATLDHLHDTLDALLVGDGKLIEGTSFANVWRKPGDLSFHQVLVTYRDDQHPSDDPEERMCGGSSAGMIAARTKAIIEAVERQSCGRLRIDRRGRAADVDPAFDTRVIPSRPRGPAATHPNLTPFDPDTELDWIRGEDLLSGEPRWVPVDLVNYPLATATVGRRLLDFANSNGVAAHTERELAIRHALLERLERHAVLRSWYDDSPPTRIDLAGLGPYIQHRANYWRGVGYDLTVLDYSIDGAPIAGVAISSDGRVPGFAFGSAAAGVQADAITKALHEAEIGMAGYRVLAPRELTADEIATPIDHGWFHAMDGERRASRFLRSGPTGAPTGTVLTSASWDALVQRLRPIVITMEAPEPLHVVRVLTPELIPIGFGAGLEYETRQDGLPHFIA